ncbi:hypothetical protein FRC12_004506 [Ceratobasidium sp. 428]|nr:hypothetical protein FRC12_004506 [Ceratobasidium sp. 428]
MLHRDLPFGLARSRGHAEPFFDGQPPNSLKSHFRQLTGSKSSRTRVNNVSQDHPDSEETLPEDVIVIIFGYLTVGELMVVRRCSKWFKHLSQNRQLWINFISHPYFPASASAPLLDDLSHHALENLVRRQFELSRTWSPKKSNASPIPIRRAYRLSMPNNESLTAMSSMDSWVAVASDLGGVYVCAPFGSDIERRAKWIRMVSVPVEINKLSVAVWHVSGREHVAVMWAGRLSIALEFQCGLVFAAVEDLVSAQDCAQGRIVLSTSDFVSSSTLQLRNPASEIMDIALGDRFCAIVDAAHIMQAFMHRNSDGEPIDPSNRSEFQGEYRSSRKTISLQFLPDDQLLFQSDSFIAVYKPDSLDSSDMVTKFITRLPSTHYFGLLGQRQSSTIPFAFDHMTVPLLALSENGAEITHFDVRLASSDVESAGANDYGFSYRRSASYLLASWMRPFSLGAINGGYSRSVWITSSEGQPFGIALGRLCIDNGDPALSYEAQLNPTELDLGKYKEALVEHAPSGPLFAFHQGEGKLLGGVRGVPDLFMMEY